MSKEIGGFLTPSGIARVIRGNYGSADGPTAIWLVDAVTDEKIATVSVNVPEVPIPDPALFFAKTYSENEVLRSPLLASGLFEDTGLRLKSGHAELELWRICA